MVEPPGDPDLVSRPTNLGVNYTPIAEVFLNEAGPGAPTSKYMLMFVTFPK